MNRLIPGRTLQENLYCASFYLAEAERILFLPKNKPYYRVYSPLLATRETLSVTINLLNKIQRKCHELP